MAAMTETLGFDEEESLVIEGANETAHQIGRDPWYQVGFVLIAGTNSAYDLGYSGSVMVPLGWIAGVVGFILAGAMSLYANTLVSHLHMIGGKRHLRYRDLASHIYGRKIYVLIWGLQYVNLVLINTGYIILAGRSLKAIYVLYRDDDMLKLPYCIAIAGVICALFAFGIPHLSGLRIWLGFSTFCSLIYIIVASVLSLKDGLNTPPRDYNIPGSRASKIFRTIVAVASLVFPFNTCMLPEIQIFASPMYEYLDTRYGRGKEKAFSFQNISFRVLVRGGYLSVQTFIAALLPFIGNFMSLAGALSTFPLAFVLSNLMYLKVKSKKLSAAQKTWHWINVIGFSCLALVAAVAALRLIVVDSKSYHLFADL